MSTIKIDIKSEGYGLQIPRTHIYVDGKFAYQSQNHPQIEKEHIQKLIDLIVIENTEIRLK